MAIHHQIGNTSLYLTAQDMRAFFLQNKETGGKAVIFSAALLTPECTNIFAELKELLRNATAGECASGTIYLGAKWFVQGSTVKVGDVEMDYLTLVDFEEACKEVVDKSLKNRINPQWGVCDGFRALLTANTVNFSDNLDIDPIRDDLIELNVMPRIWMEDIERPNYTRRDKVRRFIERLGKRRSKDFTEFIHILLKRGFDPIVEEMLTGGKRSSFSAAWAL